MLGPPTVAQTQPVIPTPVIPSFHRRIPHLTQSTGTPQQDARFGYSMLMGNVDNPGIDALDDLVVAANGTHTSTNMLVGAVYPYRGPTLDITGVTNPEQFPVPEQDGLMMGVRHPAIGRVDTSLSIPEKLVFMCSQEQNGLGPQSNSEGAVQIFRALSPAGWLFTLRPQAEPGLPYPIDVKQFGEAIAVGDINCDDKDDLVVGALSSMLCPTQASNDFNQGRIYIFFGGDGWVGDPYGSGANSKWVGIISPKISNPCPNPRPPTLFPETFGSSVLVIDFNQDGFGEVVVGAADKNGGQGAGRVYIFDGLKVSALEKGRSHYSFPGAAITPDQTLVPPAPFDTLNGWFGWAMYPIDNMGGLLWPAGKPDLFVHASGTNWNGDPVNGLPPVPNAGAGFVFYGSDNGAFPFVDPNPTVLFTPVIKVIDSSGQPVIIHSPQPVGGFGRAAAVVNWLTVVPGLGVRKLLLVGEPGADVQDPNDLAFPHAAPILGAGRVFAFQAPLDGPDGTKNAWGTFVLLEVDDLVPQRLEAPFSALTTTELGPSATALFGSSIVAGDYVDQNGGSEFVVSARQKSIPWPLPTSSTKIPFAGQAYSFRLPD
jgi:hypothetical protein